MGRDIPFQQGRLQSGGGEGRWEVSVGVEEGGESTAPPPQAWLPRHKQHCVSVSARLSVVRTTVCSSRTKGKCILVDGVPMDRQVGALAPLGR